jgi:6-pyruvoyltetrahydropterin/6-carboxytetrahydropterin synthase
VRTPEALSRFVWSELDGAVPGVRLVRVRLDAPEIRVECTGPKDVAMDVTRIYEFSAAHRLHGRGLTAEENRAVFGKCNNPEGHGHNYVLEVTWRGLPGPHDELISGELADRIVHREIVDPWDHKNLNRDLPEFADVNPTAEEIVRIAWQKLSKAFAGELEPGVRLHRLKLRETARNHVETTGE